MGEINGKHHTKEGLSYNENDILGEGSCSIVYRGRFNNMNVAVKKCLCQTNTQENQKYKKKLNDPELLLIKIEKKRHVNIVGFYTAIMYMKKSHLIMELCNGTLTDYIKNNDLKKILPPKSVNKSMLAGLMYLHSQCIAHCNIKPGNIMFIKEEDNTYRVVLGDFATVRCPVTGDCSHSCSENSSHGFISKEVFIKHGRKQRNPQKHFEYNKKSDIFSLGCVFYFTVCDGKHPFGANCKEGQSNITNGKKPQLDISLDDMPLLERLLLQMLSHNPNKRPTAKEAFNHPRFWAPEKVIFFFKYFSQAVESIAKKDKSNRNIVDDPNIIPKCNWLDNLPPKLKKYLETYQPKGTRRNIYRNNVRSVRCLLKAIRNVEEHHKDQEFPDDVRQEMGNYPEDHAKMWTTLFPKLLPFLCSKRSVVPVKVPEESEVLPIVINPRSTTHVGWIRRSQNVLHSVVRASNIPTEDVSTSEDETENLSHEIPDHVPLNSAKCTTVIQVLVIFILGALMTYGFFPLLIGKETDKTNNMYAVPTQAHDLSNLLYSVKFGTLADVRRHADTAGVTISGADYDNRNALHVAAAEGKLDIVRYLVEEVGMDIGVKDRWGFTAYEEATRFGHDIVASFFKEMSSKINSEKTMTFALEKIHLKETKAVNKRRFDPYLFDINNAESEIDQQAEQSWAVGKLLYSAYNGDLQSVKSYAEQGMDLSRSDYDGRTALHLAAAEGHEQIVRYLLDESRVSPQVKDRWGHTAYDEARGKYEDIAEILLGHRDHAYEGPESQTHCT